MIAEVLDPNKSPVITEEMVKELAHRVTFEPIEERIREGRLTGEWIVFAKHEGLNYYLSLSTHKTDDETLIRNIREICLPQFPFLESVIGG